jgi:hypothetical protein
MKNFTPEQLLEFVRWLESQINHSKNAINEANECSNYGRQAQYEGMRDAFMQCSNWFKAGQ